MKVEDVGDQSVIDKLLSEQSELKKFSEIKDSVEETHIRAKSYFMSDKIEKAIKLYQKIIQTVELASASNEKEVEEKSAILTRTHTNLIVCFNKTENWSETMQHVRQLEGIGEIESNSKALFGKGRALHKLGENAEALKVLVNALKLCPLDDIIIKAIEDVKRSVQSYEDFQKSFAKNLKLD